MTTQVIRQKSDSVILRYKSPIAMAVLPVAVALFTNGGDITNVPSVLTSGVFPIGFTLLSWGIAAKLAYKLRK
jgi:hypothetical protein